MYYLYLIVAVLVLLDTPAFADDICREVSSDPINVTCYDRNVLYIQYLIYIRTNNINECENFPDSCSNYEKMIELKAVPGFRRNISIVNSNLPTIDPNCGNYFKMRMKYYCFPEIVNFQMNPGASSPSFANDGNIFVTAYSVEPYPVFNQIKITVNQNCFVTVRSLELYASVSPSVDGPFEVILTSSTGDSFTEKLTSKFTNNFYKNFSLVNPGFYFTVSLSKSNPSNFQLNKLKMWLWVEIRYAPFNNEYVKNGVQVEILSGSPLTIPTSTTTTSTTTTSTTTTLTTTTPTTTTSTTTKPTTTTSTTTKPTTTTPTTTSSTKTTPSTATSVTAPSTTTSTSNPLNTPVSSTISVTSPEITFSETPNVGDWRISTTESGLKLEQKIGLGVGLGVGGLLLLIFVLLLCCFICGKFVYKKRGLSGSKNLKNATVSYNNAASNHDHDDHDNNNNNQTGSVDINMEPTSTAHPIPMLKNKFPVSAVNEASYDNVKDKTTKYKAVREKSKKLKTPVGIMQDFMQEPNIYYPLDETQIGLSDLQHDEIGGPINAWEDEESIKTAGKMNSYPTTTWEYNSPKAGPIQSPNTERFSSNSENRRSLADDGDDGTHLQPPISPKHYRPDGKHFKKNSKSKKKKVPTATLR